MDYDLQGHLRTYKKSITPNRKLLFKHLNTHQAITMKELYQKVADEMDRTTFFRNVKDFKKYNIAHEVVINGIRKIELTEKFTAHHHHLICLRCGEVVNIHDMKLEQYLKLLAKRRGYMHMDHSFEIQGICPACAPRNAEAAKEYAEL